MDSIAVSAAAGLRSRMEALDLLSNNLANAATGGYKSDREFYSLFQNQSNGLDGAFGYEGAGPATLPVIEKQWIDFQQGNLQPTGNPLDLALNGKGFFAVSGPSGTMYTRNGAFHMTPAGVLTTTDGYAVRDVEGKPIKADTGSPIDITPDGTVRQEGRVLGQLAMVDFSDPSVLSKTGNNYFKLNNAAAKPSPAMSASVEQGKIESSNVATAESAVRLVEIMRQYEMLQKAVSLTSEMDKQSTQEVGRVGA